MRIYRPLAAATAQLETMVKTNVKEEILSDSAKVFIKFNIFTLDQTEHVHKEYIANVLMVLSSRHKKLYYYSNACLVYSGIGCSVYVCILDVHHKLVPRLSYYYQN